ncbi:hypothetical protein COOONC_26470 [Cooperia oncophora]
MMFGLPLMTLSFLSLTSSMQPRARFSTAASFAILAMSRYLLVSKSSWELMVIGYTLVTAVTWMYLYIRLSFNRRMVNSTINVWNDVLLYLVIYMLCRFICLDSISRISACMFIWFRMRSSGRIWFCLYEPHGNRQRRLSGLNHSLCRHFLKHGK